jgi:hypothetical protein
MLWRSRLLPPTLSTVSNLLGLSVSWLFCSFCRTQGTGAYIVITTAVSWSGAWETQFHHMTLICRIPRVMVTLRADHAAFQTHTLLLLTPIIERYAVICCIYSKGPWIVQHYQSLAIYVTVYRAILYSDVVCVHKTWKRVCKNILSPSSITNSSVIS